MVSTLPFGMMQGQIRQICHVGRQKSNFQKMGDVLIYSAKELVMLVVVPCSAFGTSVDIQPRKADEKKKGEKP